MSRPLKLFPIQSKTSTLSLSHFTKKPAIFLDFDRNVRPFFTSIDQEQYCQVFPMVAVCQYDTPPHLHSCATSETYSRHSPPTVAIPYTVHLDSLSTYTPECIHVYSSLQRNWTSEPTHSVLERTFYSLARFLYYTVFVVQYATFEYED